MILILPFSFILLFFFFIGFNSNRQSIVTSYLTLCLQIFLVTEFLSFFNILNVTLIFFSHLFFVFIYVFFLKIKKRRTFNFEKFENHEYITILPIFFICLLTMIISIYSVPHNMDSLAYRMARIPHWIQNSNVNFYPINDWRQNVYSPFTEYFILHLQILTNSDYLANSVQWLGLIISIITITLITKEFGLSRNIQLFSGFFISTMPMVILQSSSTQNDLLLSSFLLSFYYFQIRLIKEPTKLNLIFSGISLGVGVLTKGTSYLFFFPIGLIFFLYSMISTKNQNKIIFFYKTILILIIGLFINIPHYLRCYMAHGDILGIRDSGNVINEKIDLFTIFSNLIRHLAYQLGSKLELANWYIYRIVQILHNGNLNDPKTTFTGTHFRPPEFSLREGHAGNLIHILLILFIIVIGIYFIKKISRFQLTAFFISILSTILYCLLLKWQPWTNKTLPLFLIVTPYIAIVFNKINKIIKNQFWVNIWFLLMFFYSLPYLFYNNSSPLFPFNENNIINKKRIEGYFVHRPQNYKQFKNIIDQIKFKDQSSLEKSVGLYIGWHAQEYQLWVMLKEKFGENLPYIYHIKTDQISSLKIDVNLPKYIIAKNKIYNPDLSKEQLDLLKIIPQGLEDLNIIHKYYEEKVIEEDFTLLSITLK